MARIVQSCRHYGAWPEADVALPLIPDEIWNEARRRADLVRPLAEMATCPRDRVRAAAADLGLSDRQIYRMVARLRAAGGQLTALLPSGPRGGRGKPRLPSASEAMTRDVIETMYLTPQKPTAAKVVREITGRCRKAGLRPPSGATIRRRLKALPLAERRRRGEAVPDAQAIPGRSPAVDSPLDLVQLDHTKVDLILVDPTDREPIGRPWVSLAIDVHSRCIAGFHLSLDPPSATSVGLCLTHVASDKAAWLAERGIEEARWPVMGKPLRIGVDNGAEFHSAAFERGCAQHGIGIDWRPPGQPHCGGIVERVIGTLMELVHDLPGTTFSTVAKRGTYDSDKAACLTLEELERWLAIAVTKFYHLYPHGGLDGDLPVHRYDEGLRRMTEAGRAVPAPRDPRAYLVDFLPILHRTLQRDGITIDHITYYANALKPWIEARDRSDPLMIRRDPRDLSRIFVLDPVDDAYIEVPYRTLSRPSVSLWEHRLARRRIAARHRQAVTEDGLFAAIEEMREIEREAARLTRSARRDRTRRLGRTTPAAPLTEEGDMEPVHTVGEEPSRPFDDIESW